MEGASLARALAIADTAATAREAAAALRTAFSPMHVVVVDAFDMRGETPAATGSRRQLYLGASDGHCWTVIADASRAAGLFVADRG
jgi:hypothetical protein